MAEAALQHARLQELVSAFVDGELSQEQGSEVEEHLRGCARCQRELALQRELSHALAREPTGRASASLRRRIEWMGEPAAAFIEQRLPWLQRWAAPALAALVLIGAAGGTVLAGRRAEASRQMAQIPVLRDALADCRRATARKFPRKADLRALAEGVQFPIRVLDRPGVELFSTWTTTLAGSPAAGLAYRWRGIVVVQYTVPTELIRKQPGMGESLTSAGFYSGSEMGYGVFAFLEGGSGTLLVATASPGELKGLIL